jgi:hypothetical protein
MPRSVPDSEIDSDLCSIRRMSLSYRDSSMIPDITGNSSGRDFYRLRNPCKTETFAIIQ